MITVTSRTNLFINNQTPTTNIYTLSLHDALPISSGVQWRSRSHRENRADQPVGSAANGDRNHGAGRDRKSTRLNSSHRTISYAVFCLKKKNMKVVSFV